jgi:signal transduction histidine kinase
MLSVQEVEQKRLARELHDRVSSTLSLIGIELSNLEGQLSGAAAVEIEDKLADCVALVQDALQVTRDISANLHPAVLNHGGLLFALDELREQFGKRTDMAVSVTGSMNAARLPAEKEVALFRITQEVLVNCAKHSRATKVSISLGSDAGSVRLSIADNGIGFNPAELRGETARRGLGLLSMQERAARIGGKCIVESRPGEGTLVTVVVRL